MWDVGTTIGEHSWSARSKREKPPRRQDRREEKKGGQIVKKIMKKKNRKKIIIDKQRAKKDHSGRTLKIPTSRAGALAWNTNGKPEKKFRPDSGRFWYGVAFNEGSLSLVWSLLNIIIVIIIIIMVSVIEPRNESIHVRLASVWIAFEW